MALPGGTYLIQKDVKGAHPHHESFKALWETKWKKPANMGVYPFMFGAVKDFEPVVEDLVIKDMKPPYDWDAFAACFFPKAEELVAEAEKAEGEGKKEKASELYLRASAVYRISRFPAPRSEKQRCAWTKGKEACTKGLGLREHPIHEVMIPHTHRLPHEGTHQPVYYHIPTHASKSNPVPLIMIVTGLDGYRTELSVWMEGWRQKGCASIVIEIPGTGDNPADPSDPKSPERWWDSTFEWVEKQEGIDLRRKVMWAFSTGGYYAIRAAHTHPSKLLGVVSQGGGCHHMFDEEWLDNANTGEYPFDLSDTLAHKFGYSDPQAFKAEASSRYSLLRDGTLDRPGCARLLVVNGTEDSIFPADDVLVCLLHGEPKEARMMADTPHMGEPVAFFVILKWIYGLLGLEGKAEEQMATIPSRPKY